MKIYNIPTINEDLFSFRLIFPGCDIISGDRHFLEHMIFQSNKRYNAQALSKEMTKLGGMQAFEIKTSPEELLISATVLKQDMPKVVNILNAILNDALFLEDEFQRVKKTLLHEHNQRVGEQQNILIKVLGKLLNKELSVIGNTKNIEDITISNLEELYGKLINRDNAVLFLHNAGDISSLLNIKKGQVLNNVKELRIEGNHECTIKEFPFSMIYLFYDVKPSLSSYALKDYLNEMDAPFYKILREQKNYCYSALATQVFGGLSHLMPWFNTTCITSNEDVNQVADALEKNLIVESEEIYKNVLNSHALNKIKAKNSIDLRFAFEYTCYILNCSFDDLKKKPTWEEFKSFADSVRDKRMAKITINNNTHLN